MKRKTSLILNIATLCLCIAAVAIGVYSAKNASLNISGQVGFTANNCLVDVTGVMNNAGYETGDGDNKEIVAAENIYLQKDATNLSSPTTTVQPKIELGGTNGTNANASFGSVMFVEDDAGVKDIVITLTLTNNSKFDVQATATITLGSRLISVTGSEEKTGTDTKMITMGTTDDEKTKTMGIILRLAGEDTIADGGTFEIQINFEKNKPSPYLTLNFVKNITEYNAGGNMSLYRAPEGGAVINENKDIKMANGNWTDDDFDDKWTDIHLTFNEGSNVIVIKIRDGATTTLPSEGEVYGCVISQGISNKPEYLTINIEQVYFAMIGKGQQCTITLAEGYELVGDEVINITLVSSNNIR